MYNDYILFWWTKSKTVDAWCLWKCYVADYLINAQLVIISSDKCSCCIMNRGHDRKLIVLITYGDGIVCIVTCHFLISVMECLVVWWYMPLTALTFYATHYECHVTWLIISCHAVNSLYYYWMVYSSVKSSHIWCIISILLTVVYVSRLAFIIFCCVRLYQVQ